MQTLRRRCDMAERVVDLSLDIFHEMPVDPDDAGVGFLNHHSITRGE